MLTYHLESLSHGYQVELSKTLGSFLAFIEERNWNERRLEHFSRKHFLEYLNASSKNPSFFNHERARLSSIIGTVLEPHDLPNPLQLIKRSSYSRPCTSPSTTFMLFSKTSKYSMKICSCVACLPTAVSSVLIRK